MADSSVAITPGSGVSVRAITGVGSGSATVQQVVTLADSGGNLVASWAPLPVQSKPLQTSTSALTQVTAATSTTTVLASNSSRVGAYVFNDSTATLYLAFASTASTTAYTLQVPPGGTYLHDGPVIYTGQLSGIWSAANGAARVTEVTA